MTGSGASVWRQIMTNEELVACIKAGVDTAENMLQLWQQNQGIIKRIAYRYQALEDVEDLIQQGYIGLCNAVEAYRQEESVPFVNYAAVWIRQNIQRYIDNCSGVVRVPVWARSEIHQLRQFESSFECETGRKPSDDEICLCMGYSQARLRQIQKSARMGHIDSLEAPVAGMETEELTLADTVADDADTEAEAISRLDGERLRMILWSMVDELPGKCPAVVRLRYQKRETLKGAGQYLGMTMEAARQWERKALRELGKPSRAWRLRPFLDETQEGAAYHTGGLALFNRTWTSSTERAAMQ